MYYINILIRKIIWRKKNKHNKTMYGFFNGPLDIVSVGNFSYGVLNVVSVNTDNKLYIGNFCSIAGNVQFLLGGEHSLDFISTYPIKSMILGKGIDAKSKGDIVVDDDVWIGQNAIVLSGVHIAQGAVIAAGSVVTKDVPMYAIVGGNPAKVIKYRFSQEVINELIKIDYSRITNDIVKNNIDDFYKKIEDKDQVTKIRENIMK